MNDTVSAADLVQSEALLDDSSLRASATHVVRVDLAGTVVDVRFNDREAARLYRSRYRHMLSAATPRRRAYAAAAESRVGYFWLEGDAVYRWDRSELTPNVVTFLADAVINTGVFTSAADTIALHAATVGNAFGVAAVIGISTAGKTTTAIACARRGLDLYSDEYCVLAPSGVLPFPRSISIRCAATEVLANDPVSGSAVDAWLQTHGCCDGYDLGYDELFGAFVRPEVRPLRAAFALVGRSEKPQAKVIPARAMVEHVRPWAKTSLQGVERLQRLLVLFGGVRCCELVLGSPDASAREIARCLEESARTEAA